MFSFNTVKAVYGYYLVEYPYTQYVIEAKYLSIEMWRWVEQLGGTINGYTTMSANSELYGKPCEIAFRKEDSAKEFANKFQLEYEMLIITGPSV